MAQRVQVKYIRDMFISRLRSATQLKSDIRALQSVRGSGGLNPSQAHRVIELAFLDMMSAWEVFLDDVVVRYLCGAQPPVGTAPVLLKPKCQRLSDAWALYTAIPGFDPDHGYVSANLREAAIKQGSPFFLGGNPFKTALDGSRGALVRATVIRNRVAHESRMASASFKKVATKMRGSALSQGYQAGQLLLARVQPQLGLNTTKPDYFDAYASLFDTLARKIVP